MNCILVYPEELVSERRAVLRGARAQYVKEWHEVQEGLQLKAGVWGRQLGSATVLEISAEQVVLEIELNHEAPPREDIDLVVAVPRPQTVKKILQLAAMSGIKKLHLVKTARVVKSYLQSKTLREENIRLELLKGLEQGCDVVAPQVELYSSLRVCLDQWRSASSQCIKVVADTQATGTLAQFRLARGQPMAVAIGPESGWQPFELDDFRTAGFTAINIGNRMLRVDVAASNILGQVSLLRRLSPG